MEGHIWSDLIAESNIGQLSLSLTLSELLFIHSLGEQHTHSLSPKRPWIPNAVTMTWDVKSALEEDGG